MSAVLVSGAFDTFRSAEIRFLQEAGRHGDVHVVLWSDEVVRRRTGKAPRFALDERRYLLRAVRWVRLVHVLREPTDADALPAERLAWIHPKAWVVEARAASDAKHRFCQERGLAYRVLAPEDLAGFPEVPPSEPTGRPKVIVTGCFDWLHSGHVRFFEEASQYGDLIVALGHDDNIRLLKGHGHPLFPEAERRYLVASIRSVHEAVVTTGSGWMDAAPEIERLRPDIYVVNEDGDRPEKRAFCAEHGLEYVVLRRVPKHGLPPRQSTDLRGF